MNLEVSNPIERLNYQSTDSEKCYCFLVPHSMEVNLEVLLHPLLALGFFTEHWLPFCSDHCFSV